MKTTIRIALVAAAAIIIALGYTERLKSVTEMISLLGSLLIIAGTAEFAFGYLTVTIRMPIAFAAKLGTDGQPLVVNGKPVVDETKPTKFGTLKMFAKDVNPSSVTNAASTEFFDGGMMPGATRQAIIRATNPAYAATVETVS